MKDAQVLDGISQRIVGALDRDPRGTIGWLAQTLGLARGTVQARIAQLFTTNSLRPQSTTVRPLSVGYPLRAFITAEVVQSDFDSAMRALRQIPEVLECVAVSGAEDLICQIVARDTNDLYRVGQDVLRCPGIRRTSTSLVLKELIPYRMGQLLASP